MGKHKLVVFDFDGTLVDTAPDIIYHVNTVLREFGYPPSAAARVREAVGHGVHRLVGDLAGDLGNDMEKLERAVRRFKALYAAEPVLRSAAYPDVARMLEGPLKPFRKAVLTNKLHSLTESILVRLDLRRHFDLVIGDGSGFPMKPDPASMFHLLKQLGVSKEETLFVGDSEVDRKTAENSGVDFLWASYGYSRTDVLPSASCSSPSEWAEHLSRTNNK